MESLVPVCIPSLHIRTASAYLTSVKKPMFLNFQINPIPNSSFSLVDKTKSKFKLFTALSPSVSTEASNAPEAEPEMEAQVEKFDWYSQWYPVMPVCDLDKRAPHGKKVMGLDVVVWWDRNESSWKVFDDVCSHRLAPLSEGRIDQWGRLQCVYHGWCFNGSGECKFIPQAPPEGPPVHTFKKACVAAYPSTVQNDILWFWPNTDPQYKDILSRKRPPYIPELDDPSFTKLMGNRDIPYGTESNFKNQALDSSGWGLAVLHSQPVEEKGEVWGLEEFAVRYEVLIENLMDPAHVPYAHYGIMRTPQPKMKADREGGRPLDLSIEKLDTNGFRGNMVWGKSKFMAPCVYYAYPDQPKESASLTETKKPSAQKKALLIFVCIPVSPGKSRLIWSFPRNFGIWIDKIVPRWMFHVGRNLTVLDSDLYLLHVEEHKIMDVGPANWQRACFLPTKSDAQVVGFRKWLNKYAGGQVDWRGKYSGVLPPTPPREQLMDRYWSHVVNCQSCNFAYKSLNVVEVMLQIMSFAAIGIVATMKQGTMSAARRNSVVLMAILSFALSRWLAHFIYKNFWYHDYNHAFR